MKVEAAGPSETLAISYHTVRRHIGNGSALHIYLRANSKPNKGHTKSGVSKLCCGLGPQPLSKYLFSPTDALYICLGVY